MIKEELLKIWLESEPTARSPYKIEGCPPMWETVQIEDKVLFTRPARTMTRPFPLAPYVEVDGISYQFQKDGEWIGQGGSTTFEAFETKGPQFCR